MTQSDSTPDQQVDQQTGQPSDDAKRAGRYRALVANSPYCIHEIDRSGHLISMNPAGIRMMEAKDECEIIGLRYLDVVGEEDRERISELLDAAFDGRLSEFEFTAINGSIFRSNFVPLPGETKARLMGISQDITQQRALEQQVHQSRQLEAIGRLAGGVAHDFNNLLTIIFGAAEMLKEKLTPDSDPDVASILRAAHRGGDLTSQLLAFARRQVLHPKVIDLKAHLNETGQLLRRLLTERVSFSIDAEALCVRIDPGQLDQVLVNLVANARDAMPDGGELSIGVTSIDQPRGLPAGSYLRISVQDNGTGMPPEVLPHIYDPFFTTKKSAQGTGLGLATSHGIVHQAGGRITAESAPGEGSTFAIDLPIVDELPDSPTDSVEVPKPKEITILLIEDESDLRANLERSLTLAGHRVLTASSGEDALKLPVDQKVDLILSDVILPGMTGPQAAEQLRRDRPDLRVLFMSGYPDSSSLPEDEAHFLSKPFRTQTLLKKIHKVLLIKN